MTDRFDLEQQILNCWRITSDMNLLVEQNAEADGFKALAKVYEYQFESLWEIFEKMVSEKQFSKGTK
jgi:hypothetical protein